MSRNLFNELQSGLTEIRDHPEKLKRTERTMIEIGEKCDSGIHKVFVDTKHVGDIVKTDREKWLAIPMDSRHHTAHKLRRDAVAALN